MVYLVFAIIGALVCGVIASQKERNAFGWAVLGALFPLIAAIAILCLPPAEQPQLPMGPQ